MSIGMCIRCGRTHRIIAYDTDNPPPCPPPPPAQLEVSVRCNDPEALVLTEGRMSELVRHVARTMQVRIEREVEIEFNTYGPGVRGTAKIKEDA